MRKYWAILFVGLFVCLAQSNLCFATTTPLHSKEEALKTLAREPNVAIKLKNGHTIIKHTSAKGKVTLMRVSPDGKQFSFYPHRGNLQPPDPVILDPDHFNDINTWGPVMGYIDPPPYEVTEEPLSPGAGDSPGEGASPGEGEFGTAITPNK